MQGVRRCCGLCALLWLTACAGPERVVTVTRVETVCPPAAVIPARPEIAEPVDDSGRAMYDAARANLEALEQVDALLRQYEAWRVDSCGT